jgi:hypothetical protein
MFANADHTVFLWKCVKTKFFLKIPYKLVTPHFF